MRECKFFPTVAEIWDHVPPAQVKAAETIAEMKALQGRAKKGEKFFGMSELQEAMRKMKTVEKRAMPSVRTIFPDIDPDRNAETLERQKRELLEGK